VKFIEAEVEAMLEADVAVRTGTEEIVKVPAAYVIA
jgi:hypothetical protein